MGLGHFLAGAAAALLLFAYREGHAADGLPLGEASVELGEIFPARLSEIETSCSVPAARKPPVLDEFRREWYSKHLAAAGEPSLVSIADAAPAHGLHLRFIWLRSFGSPVVVRVSVTPEHEARLSAKRLSGAGGYDPGEIAQQVERVLEPAETRRLEDYLTSSRLLDESAETCELGLDGARWIVEAVDGDSYYFIDRWSPEEGSVHEFGLLMLELTGWPINPEAIY